jgi:hypothetical protein
MHCVIRHLTTPVFCAVGPVGAAVIDDSDLEELLRARGDIGFVPYCILT